MSKAIIILFLVLAVAVAGAPAKRGAVDLFDAELLRVVGWAPESPLTVTIKNAATGGVVARFAQDFAQERSDNPCGVGVACGFDISLARPGIALDGAFSVEISSAGRALHNTPLSFGETAPQAGLCAVFDDTGPSVAQLAARCVWD